MASIQKKNNKYCVVYYCKDTEGKRKQKWETYDTKNEAKIRKAEIELKEKKGGIIVSNCKTLEDLINEYVELYGKDRWALSTYDGNMSLLKNYILPIIGKTPLTDINTRFLEIYYKTLTKTPSVPDLNGNVRSEFVSTSVIRDVHKLLKSCFNQAVKWDIMEKNPAFKATVPKHKSEKRVIWDAETFAYALDVCENECLKLCMNLAFAGSLRIGELLGLTWDCVDISEEAIKENRAYLYVNKEVQRVSKKALEELDQKDVIVIFPEERKTNKTVRIMKTPKTESSVPPLKKDTPSDVVAFIWAYMKVPENSREKVKNLLKDANKNGVKLSHQAPTLYDVVPKEEITEFEELMRKTIADIVSEASSIACWVYVQKYVKHKTLNEMLQELPDVGQFILAMDTWFEKLMEK